VVLNPLDRSGVRAHAQDAGQKPSQRSGEMMKVGDLVKVDESIFISGTTKSRVGVIIEKAPEMDVKRLGASKPDDIMNILLAGQTLHFHKMFLETV
jgi:hypothetical protein